MDYQSATYRIELEKGIKLSYCHRSINHTVISLPVGKVVCVGRNYVDHIQELNNEVPEEPLLFIKPATSLCDVQNTIRIPQNLGACHNEIEVCVLLKDKLRKTSADAVLNSIWGVGIGLDLTLRDLQTKLKSKGLPWERAKGFDDACPVSAFVPIDEIQDVTKLPFSLKVNHEKRQDGNTGLMIWSIASLLSEISQVFTLMPGDIVMTGTPKGVGPLYVGDKLTLTLADKLHLECQVETQ